MHYFFTDNSYINTTQVAAEAYGPLPSDGAVDRFNLENRFAVSADAPALALCKSLLLAQEDSSDATLVNIALLPLDAKAFINIPVKFIIYRGIRKSSLYDASGNVNTDFTGWKPQQNILFRIKQIQDKINAENGQNVVATKKYFGSHFVENIYLEKAFFLGEGSLGNIPSSDLFYPLVVDAGFEIGKFFGGSKKAGIQIIIDKIGYEPKLADLRKNNDVFEVPVVGPNPTNEAILKDRTRKDKILAYLDYTALLGSQFNNNYSDVKNYNTTTAEDTNLSILNALGQFYNKNTVYFDIRNEYGSSYNILSTLNDVVKVGLKTPSSGSEYFTQDFNYYDDKWPIFLLRNYILSEPGSTSFNDKMFLSLPILNGAPIFDYYLYAYTFNLGARLSVVNFDNDLSKKHEGIKMLYSNEIEITGKVNNNMFVCNYLLCKLSGGTFLEGSNPVNEVFRLDMNTIIGDDDLTDGDFKVYVYSSLNSPLIRKKDNVYAAEIGIAKDKYNVSFFVYKTDTLISDKTSLDNPLRLVTTGNFKFQAYLDEFDYQPGQTLGFLSALPFRFTNNEGGRDYDLKKFSIVNSENALTQFLSYIKIGSGTRTDEFYDNFDCVTISTLEYMDLLKEVINVDTSDYYTAFYDYFQNYLDRINFTSDELSETFDVANYLVFRFYPALLHISIREPKESDVVSENYSARTDKVRIKVLAKRINTNDKPAFLSITTGLVLNSLHYL